MAERPVILVVSASAGNGHVRAAAALEEELRGAGAATVHVDVLELAPRWVRTAYGGGFELLASRAPRIWREVYVRSDGPHDDAARWGSLAHSLLFREFRRLLGSRPWTACVCTHFLPGQLAAGRPGLPLFASVITDFTLHRYWVQPRVGLYFAPTPEVAQELGRRLPRAASIATGIPVAAGFTCAPSRQQARAALGIPDEAPVVLVMGGGFGLGVEAAVDVALRTLPAGRVLAVTGRNAGAEARLRAAARHLNAPGADRLHVLGYTSQVPVLMSAADVVVTKPGGITCSEALAVGRPLVLTRAIPGHEEANVTCLTGRGAAIHAPDGASLERALARLFGDAARLAAATGAARAAGTPGAARSIAQALLRRSTRDAAA